MGRREVSAGPRLNVPAPPQGRPGAGAKGKPSRPKHDPGQKRLFSHRHMVADLLRLPEGLAGDIDLSRFTPNPRLRNR